MRLHRHCTYYLQCIRSRQHGDGSLLASQFILAIWQCQYIHSTPSLGQKDGRTRSLPTEASMLCLTQGNAKLVCLNQHVAMFTRQSLTKDKKCPSLRWHLWVSEIKLYSPLTCFFINQAIGSTCWSQTVLLTPEKNVSSQLLPKKEVSPPLLPSCGPWSPADATRQLQFCTKGMSYHNRRAKPSCHH